MTRIILAVISYFLVTGCASIVSGQDQVVSVTTPNCSGAKCTLTNDAGTFYVTTPGTVSVNREYGDVIVSCEAPNHEPMAMRVSSSTKGMAFGNILFGGVIGAGVDVATGAAYDYPSEIIHPLECRTKEQIASAPNSGRFDQQAKILVDPTNCEEPSFVFRDGQQDVYKSRCVDGTVGVIGCSESGCQPLNVASAVSSQENANTSLPQYASDAQDIGREHSCSKSFHVSDVSAQGETWMAKCETGDFLVINCSAEGCSTTR